MTMAARSMPSAYAVAILAASLLAGSVMSGCGVERWWDPSAMVRQNPQSPVRPIEPGLTPTDYGADVYPNSSPPREGDWEFRAEDYIIGPGDVVEVRIMDLFEPNQEYPLQRQVSTSGFIDLPLVQQIRAEGLTRGQLRDAIVSAYSPDVIRNPIVSVTVLAERQNVFSILGAIARPGQYNQTRKDMTLLEALALGGGPTQTGIQYIYVIRSTRPTRVDQGAAVPPAPRQPSGEGAMPPAMVPPAPGAPTAPAFPTVPALPPAVVPELPPAVVPGLPPLTAPATSEARELEQLLPGAPATTPTPKPSVLPRFSDNATAGSAGATAPALDQDLIESTDVKWVFSPSSGRYVPMTRSTTLPTQPVEQIQPYTKLEMAGTTMPATEQDPFGWKRISKADSSRVIAINLAELNKGNPQMNIVIRDNDIIQIPLVEPGEFYVMGEVARPGVYSLAGRHITVKMAVAAAGNLGPLSWPKNSILIRRINGVQERIFPVDVEAIFHGEANDFFLRPDDVLAVGQSAASPFIIVMRNAFRLTYGFGFIYDRNFADPVPPGLNSRRFTVW